MTRWWRSGRIPPFTWRRALWWRRPRRKLAHHEIPAVHLRQSVPQEDPHRINGGLVCGSAFSVWLALCGARGIHRRGGYCRHGPLGYHQPDLDHPAVAALLSRQAAENSRREAGYICELVWWRLSGRAQLFPPSSRSIPILCAKCFRNSGSPMISGRHLLPIAKERSWAKARPRDLVGKSAIAFPSGARSFRAYGNSTFVAFTTAPVRQMTPLSSGFTGSISTNAS